VKAEHAATGSEIADHHRTAKHRRNAGLIVDCLGLLGIFRLFRQVTTVNRHRGGQHKDIGVYDRITWNFVRYILSYRRQMAPRVRQPIADHAGNAEVVVMRSRRAARDYLAAVSVQASPSARAVAAGEERS
jgi:hypothetical protein